ncbi:chemotaxis protein CheD [Mesorhizobium xinjiangense]|uniref:chemotaxis protein CheD n=1 Tax=Mesorhizobium xinjiangense TaxID=2678685 RepID=UPI001F18C8E9|nr:chemotaxis protein CheD [Mesorhizobium xinjiangense]
MILKGRPDRIHVIQGDCIVTDDASVTLTTVLGSCVAACMRDPVLGIGGMNHFLLPGDGENSERNEAERFGVYLMELLVNGLLKRGARRDKLEAKLFGGARTMQGVTDVGAKNIEFARRFLDTEAIACLGGSVGGDQGRRLEYQPSTGRARQFLLPSTAVAQVSTPRPVPARAESGTLELF